MTQLTINGKTLGVVDVPDRQHYFDLYNNGLVMKLVWNEMTATGKFKQMGIILDPGQWSILGRLNDITEEQAAEIRSHGIEGNPLIILNEKV